MKKTIYIILLIAISTGLKAQFAGVLTNDGFTRLDNDSALLTPDENLRGSFQWQNSPDSTIWTDVDANLTGDTLAFAADSTEAYRLKITDGTCSPIYSDTVKVFNKNTSVSEYVSAGISTSDLLAAEVSVSDLLDEGISVSELIAAGASVMELFDEGIMVGTLEQSGADSLELANAGLIGVLTDFDSADYKWVRIGDQYWMAENLRTTHYADSTAIPLVDANLAWGALSNTSKAYCYYNNDSTSNAGTYGALYTWAAAMNGQSSSDNNPSGIQGVCPSGWHLPGDAEWKQLEMSLGMSQSGADSTEWRGTNEGSKLAGNASLWNNGNLENNAAFGSSGFKALPGGYRGYNGAFSYLGDHTDFWSATEVSRAWHRYLYYNYSEVGRYYGYKNLGFSVRCTKD